MISLQHTAQLLDAVRYALRRVQTDPGFAYHMLHTETMERLVRAVAATTGEEYEGLMRVCSEDKQPEYRRMEPQLVVERRRMAALELVIDRLAKEARIGWERLEEVRDEATRAVAGESR